MCCLHTATTETFSEFSKMEKKKKKNKKKKERCGMDSALTTRIDVMIDTVASHTDPPAWNSSLLLIHAAK
ncbi:hypothetical protein E4U43_003341 [Claviceps pusilla]|uniref:Uncharacterized protein n=1 Tax=Claviceps pusilla TaxID=123648 RepID=A0A9P7N5I0_9HYPO|nr:hypothetical protein E4U43_003341 [Claviceps pusilla]